MVMSRILRADIVIITLVFTNFVLCGFTVTPDSTLTDSLTLPNTTLAVTRTTEDVDELGSTTPEVRNPLSTTKDNATEEQEEFAMKPEIEMNYVDLVFVPSSLVIGCVGNAITVVTMSTLPFRRMTWSIVLIWLAVADTVMLWVIAVRKPFVVAMLGGVDILSLTNAGCKVFHFTRRAAKMMSSWFVVLICVERFVAICFPLKVKEICTKRKTVVGIVVILIVGIVFGGTSSDTVLLVASVCRPADPNPAKKLQGQISLLLGSTLIAWVPMLILILLTPIICFTLLRQRRARTKLASSADQGDAFTRVSAMLVSVHSSYVVLVLPHFIYTNFKYVRMFNRDMFGKDFMNVFSQVSGVLELVNHSINFFLYVGFNSMFRKRLTEVFSRSTSISDVRG